MPRTPHRSLNRRNPSPSRVPPDQSTTASAALAQGGVGIVGGQLAGDARDPGPEREHLDLAAPATGHRRVGEAGERAGVRLHRPAHVEEQDEPAGPLARLDRGRSSTSPPVRSDRRTVRRRSSSPRAAAGRPTSAAADAGPPAPAGRPSAGAPRPARRACTPPGPGGGAARWRSTAPCGRRRRRRARSLRRRAARRPRRRRRRAGPRPAAARPRTSARRMPAEHGAERRVVGGDVLGPADQRRPTRPVGARGATARRAPAPGRSSTVAPVGARATRRALAAPRPARTDRSRSSAGRPEAVGHASGTAGDRLADERVDAVVADPLLVLAVLDDRAERGLGRRGRRGRPAEQRRAPAPSRSSRRCPAACRARACGSRRPPPPPGGPASPATSGARSRTIATSRSTLGLVDPVVEAAALERVVHVAGAVGREDRHRRASSPAPCPARGW